MGRLQFSILRRWWLGGPVGGKGGVPNNFGSTDPEGRGGMSTTTRRRNTACGGREAAMNRTLAITLNVVLGVCLWTGGSVLAAGTWADEIVTAATFYKSSYPTGNWAPYFEKLMKVQEGIGRGD